MAYQTFPKRGKVGKNPGKTHPTGEHNPANMYAASDFGGGRPGSERRFSGNYGKNAKARNEVDTEAGAETRRTGRMFNWIKGDSY